MSISQIKYAIGLSILAICNLVQAMLPELGDEDCGSLILISNWKSNNVKIYDGCSGLFVRDLDSQSLIDGPLGILQTPDGDLLVVSENNNRLIKWDFLTLSNGSEIMGSNPNTSAFIDGPSGAIIGKEGFMYAASFTQNLVVKIDTRNWQIIDELLSSSNTLISGIDAGLALRNGHLYLPGFKSDNIIKINLSSKQASEIVSQNSGELNAPRSIIVYPNRLTVAAEKSNVVSSFDLSNGNFIHRLVQVASPTSIQRDNESHFLISTQNSVYRVTNDGKSFEKIIKKGAGGLNSATFVYRLYKKVFDTDQK